VVATRDQAETDLRPYAERFLRCIREAVLQYLDEHGRLAYRYSKRTQASIIHDYMVDRIKAEFDGEPGVTWRLARNLFVLNVHNKYLIKLKKHDRAFKTSNIMTQLTFDWLTQKQLELPGMPDPATHLHLGYQPGYTLASSTYVITCRDGSVIEWVWPLMEAEPTVLRLPERPPATTRRRRVRPRALPRDTEAAADASRE
jgi:hypothetical protein